MFPESIKYPADAKFDDVTEKENPTVLLVSLNIKEQSFLRS